MLSIKDELQQVQTLLKMEQQEDLEQYKLKSARSPISVRKHSGLCWYPIVITKSDIGFGGKVVIEIERTAGRDQLHLFQAGKAASVFSNASGSQGHDNPTLNGVIMSLRRNKLTLATNKEDLPDWIEDGKLGIDLTFDEMSYKEMEFALKKVMDAEGTKLAHLRDVLYGATPANFKSNITYLPIESLNESQNEAVKNIEASCDVAIIHGPPGTGKTTTLVQAVLRTLETESRLLVCAPSNTAVDLLTEKLAEKGVNVIRIGHPSRVSEMLLNHTLDAQVMNHREYKQLKLLRKNAEEYKNLGQQYKRSFGWEEREQRRMYKEESRKMLQEADDIERYITDDLVSRVQVITCTLVGSANRVIRHLTYDTVFIDEAAQALEPGCWIPITRTNRVVLAGDHFQLPPTVKSEKADRLGLSKTLFEKCVARQPDIAVMLKTQYRMHHHIMAFSNNQFYCGELQAHDSVRFSDLHHFNPAFTDGLAVEFIDTAGCGYLERAFSETSSIANPEEADLLLKHLQLLLSQFPENSESAESFSEENPKANSGKNPEAEREENDAENSTGNALKIGVISPYRAQINYLQDQVEQMPELHEMSVKKLLSIGTVDSFQGQERDIIYISMVRSNETGEIGFLSDIRRMNVAMTRAKKKLVIVGDSATLGSDLFYREFVEYTESIGAYKSGWEYINS